MSSMFFAKKHNYWYVLSAVIAIACVITILVNARSRGGRSEFAVRQKESNRGPQRVEEDRITGYGVGPNVGAPQGVGPNARQLLLSQPAFIDSIRLRFAQQYAEFFRRRRLSDEKREAVIEGLTEVLLAKAAGGDGKAEEKALLDLLGQEDGAALTKYTTALPSIERAEEVEAYFKDHGLPIGDEFDSVRESLESTPLSKIYADRMAEGRLLYDAEEQQIKLNMKAELEPVRLKLRQQYGSSAVDLFDHWLEQKIDAQIAFLRKSQELYINSQKKTS